jgi:hypothetical protein
MRKRIIANVIIIGVVCSLLAAPAFALGAEGNGHWSKGYIDQLSEDYDVAQAFDEKDPDDVITMEDFQNLVRLTVDEQYDGAPDTTTREAVVYELTSIWAKKVGKELESIPVIKMLIYSDTDSIDAKYRQGIIVAYMRDIAKGKGERVFDPKAGVTYGELAVLLLNTVKAIQDEPDIEEQGFVTRGSYEIGDDRAVFDFELVNNHAEPKRLQFGSGQQFELTITDEKGQEVYRYSDGKFFTMALIFKDMEPGEALKWQDEWDMTNKDGQKLTSGDYKAKIEVLVIPEEDGEKIDPAQLTTVLEFSLDGQPLPEAE